ncbi:dTMP kinase [Lentibacter algarum]|uniref:dTMP kinase n=1 Tax=Lentibacter algarum TaxID=576131 RepID=UPI003AF5005F
MFVSFSGLDGCGKSTQLDRLEEALVAEGRRPVRLWSRGGYTEGILWAKRVARRLAGAKLPPSGKSEARTRALGNPRIARLWLGVAILDLIRVYGVQVRLWRIMGRPVLCDRYALDTWVDFKMDFPHVEFDRTPLWRVLRVIAPEPKRSFFFLLDPEEAQRRALQKGDPWPEDFDRRVTRSVLYEGLLEEGNFNTLDAREAPGTIHERIIQSLSS